MKMILDFFTGPLNTLAWMYILLPCVFFGGLYFTIRNKGMQFTRFGHAMKNTIGKIFELRWQLPLAPAISSVPARPSHWVATALCSGCGLQPCWA